MLSFVNSINANAFRNISSYKFGFEKPKADISVLYNDVLEIILDLAIWSSADPAHTHTQISLVCRQWKILCESTYLPVTISSPLSRYYFEKVLPGHQAPRDAIEFNIPQQLFIPMEIIAVHFCNAPH